MSRMLYQHRYSKTVKLSDDIYCYEFTSKQGNTKTYALWAVDRGATVNLQTQRPVTVVDLMGNSMAVKPVGGVVSIAVSGSPVFVKGLKRVVESQQSAFKLEALPGKPFTSMDTIRIPYTYIKGVQGDVTCSLPAGWSYTVKDSVLEITPARRSASGNYEIVAHKGAMGSAVSILLDNSISVSNLPLVEDGVELTFSNPFSQKQVIAVSTSADKEKKPEHEITLDAAARKTYLLKVQPLTDKGYVTVPLDLHMAVKTAPSMKVQYSPDARKNLVAGFTPCFAAPDTQIDGNIDAWSKHPPMLLQKDFQAKGIGKKKYGWKGVSDLSAKAYTGYDKTGFYFAAEVIDDRHVQPYPSEQAWKGDSVQLAFYRDKTRYEFTLSSKDGGQLYQSSPVKGGAKGASVSVNRSEGKTVYETHIPWVALGEGTKPPIRFAMLINDCDSPASGGMDGRRGFLEWFEGIGGAEGKQPQLYSVLKYMQ